MAFPLTNHNLWDHCHEYGFNYISNYIWNMEVKKKTEKQTVNASSSTDREPTINGVSRELEG